MEHNKPRHKALFKTHKFSKTLHLKDFKQVQTGIIAKIFEFIHKKIK